MKIDLERCKRGMEQLRVEGIPRGLLIEEAIAGIQRDPVGVLRERYFGIKNYAGFGDQREDHNYGMGPRHGHIVFRIERTDKYREAGKALDADAVYYLEAYRDFGAINWEQDGPGVASYERVIQMDLARAIRAFDHLNKRRNELADAFERAEIQTHVLA